MHYIKTVHNSDPSENHLFSNHQDNKDNDNTNNNYDSIHCINAIVVSLLWMTEFSSPYLQSRKSQ